MRHAGGWLESLASLCDALLPGGCAVCGSAVASARSPICRLCEARIQPVPGPWCPRCSLTRVLPGPTPDECAACHTWPPVLPRAASACLHSGGAAELVRGLKYRGWTALAGPMAARMLPAARRVSSAGAVFLVPVPITRAKRRERGFNQADLLARGLARLSGWTVHPILIRTGGGPPLARLGRRRRRETVQHAFALRTSPPVERFDPGLRRSAALLVDDVITTGATAAACAEALAGAGVTCCGAVSFSRTRPLDGMA